MTNQILHPDAVALRPVRVVSDEFRYYSATTFPDGPWRGCELTLRRCQAFGYLVDEDEYAVVDVLDDNSDILQEFGVTHGGFQYLRQVLRFKVD